MPLQPRVLMVEDHPDIAALYPMPDLIRLDMHMPLLDGLQLLAALRDDETTDGVPVVVCSEDDSPQLMKEARRLGAVGYLVKANLLPSRLSQTVGDVLGQRGEFTIDAGRPGARQAS